MNKRIAKSFRPGRHAPAIFAILAVLALSASPPVWSHDANDPRHIAMEGLAKNLKKVGTAVKEQLPLDTGVKTAARQLHQSAEEMLSLFPEGSIGHKSRAKPEIWQYWPAFMAAADRFQ